MAKDGSQNTMVSQVSFEKWGNQVIQSSSTMDSELRTHRWIIYTVSQPMKYRPLDLSHEQTDLGGPASPPPNLEVIHRSIAQYPPFQSSHGPFDDAARGGPCAITTRFLDASIILQA